MRRTWAPRGQRPLLAQKGTSRQKVSVAAGLWVAPARERLGLFSWTLINDYFDNVCSATFIESLLQELGCRVSKSAAVGDKPFRVEFALLCGTLDPQESRDASLHRGG